MDEPILGMIQLFGFGFGMDGWHICDGTTLQISQYQALYSLLGNVYGGNAAQGTFALPNLINASPVPGMKYYIAMSGLYPTRD